jgi:TusA-related sulfurtransferase
VTESSPDYSLDLRGTPCPLNWVKTKLRLEEMEVGGRIEVIVDQGNPARNVPRSAQMDGHRIVRTISQNGAVRICIERG